jgi:predicted RNA-binding Zn-ribbon protein involved in translation (DUF1610 family)
MSEHETAVIVRPEIALTSWTGAAQRGLIARRERESIVAELLTPGTDFGVIPGTEKPVLLKPGAEKITDALGLYPDYECLDKIEDWEAGLFHYRYRCVLRQRGGEMVIATGIGSCNSRESRYRWRYTERTCPSCGKATILKSRKEGQGWFCWRKRGGCGQEFPSDAEAIVSQEIGRVESDDTFSVVNTIDKMAQKRSLVAANLNLGFSDRFTQDLEDHNVGGEPEKPRPKVQQPQRKPDTKAGIQEPPDLPEPEAKPAGMWRGEISSVETRKQGEFTVHRVTCGDAKTQFSTVEADLAGEAKSFAGTGEEVICHYTSERTKGGVGYKRLVSLEAAMQPAEE